MFGVKNVSGIIIMLDMSTIWCGGEDDREENDDDMSYISNGFGKSSSGVEKVELKLLSYPDDRLGAKESRLSMKEFEKEKDMLYVCVWEMILFW